MTGERLIILMGGPYDGCTQLVPYGIDLLDFYGIDLLDFGSSRYKIVTIGGVQLPLYQYIQP